MIFFVLFASRQKWTPSGATAWKCPYTDGSAVFQARAMLSEYDTIQYYNTCELYTTNSQARVTNTNNSRNLAKEDVGIYPNPTNGLVYITTEQDVLEVQVIDLAGKVLLTSFRPKKVDLSQFAKGIYILKIKTTSGTSIKKLVKE